MHILLPGYERIETLHEDGSTVIYRAREELSRTSVLIKSLKAEYPTLEELTQLRHEYKILQFLTGEGIVKAYSLENHQNGLALILEDFGGKSLKKVMSDRPLTFADFFKLSIQIASILGDLHERHIIHKNIKPQNILINPETLQLKINDFSISSRLPRETQAIANPYLLEGTLAYMSPEQTGRMNRSLDYRTDFYSLGITFYEMLTGQLPFQSTDPLGLIHCHIAKRPVPPHELNPEISTALSDIVMKLLSKSAEDRYQSAYGLKSDLEECFRRGQTRRGIESFVAGKMDLFSQFIIPQKLYGREQELTTLMDAFERVADPQNKGVSKSTTEMMLVSGYSGIGKSSLVQEINKPIVRQRGYFITGKFDQFKQNIPYAALIQAFQELMRQLLTETPENLAGWKAQLLNAFGEQGKLIIDVIPEVALIVGPQPDVPQVGSIESQNRFNRVFQAFIQVFAKPEHPLVLFLDDLQWADSASLKLIHLLMSDDGGYGSKDSQYLLLIGAYRDNEVDPTHPLIHTLEEIRSYGTRVNNITLRPLNIINVSQVLADTFHDEPGRLMPLAELVYNKTQGNPFFLNQLLATLHQEKLLTFDFTSGRWQWSLEQIQSIGITDLNVVELIARNIQKLPQNTQNILKIAACIGDLFTLDVLAIVNEKSPSETAADLWEGLQAGLILPQSESYKIPLVGEWGMDREAWQDGKNALDSMRYAPCSISYKFLHDRVQQATYFLIPESQKKETRLKIGELLLKHTPPQEIEDKIFEIVNQLNVVVEFIAYPPQKYELAQLNLIAGKKAKAATAYEAAAKYLGVGLELLAENCWAIHYGLTLDLYVEAAEAEFLNTNFERSQILADVVLQQANKLLDKVKVYELKMNFYFAQNQMLKAIDTGLSVLDLLGFSLDFTPSDRGVELPQLADLEEMPEMTDLNQLAAMRILMAIASYAYSANPQMYLPLILAMVNLCIERGHSVLSAYAYAQYGVILCGSVESIESGYHSGELGLKLLELFRAKQLTSKIYQLFNVFIRHFKEHIRETISPLVDALHSALEIGDLEYAGYAAFNYGVHLFLIGEQLDNLDGKQVRSIELLEKIKQKFTLENAKIWRQFFLNLMGKSPDKYRLIGDSFNEAETLPIWEATNNYVWLFTVYCTKLILLYLFKKPEMAVENAQLSAKHAESSGGWIVVPVHNFYYSLALLAACSPSENMARENALNQVEINQEKMKKWAALAPCNFKHKYELVEAEKARILGNIFVAMEYYDRAIQGAKEFGYIQEEALANERAAEFYFSRGREKVARDYLTESYYGYIRWGAMAKVRDLEERYPIVFSQIWALRSPSPLTRLATLQSSIVPTGETTESEVTHTTTSSTPGLISAALDLSTVVKASQAISGEILLDNLLNKLMNILIENAGARTGILFLQRAGQWMLVAEGSVETDNCIVLSSIPIQSRANLPFAIINYVQITQRTVVLNDATQEGLFTNDSYIIKNKPKSILGLPILYQSQLKGILYLENNLTQGAFTQERLEVLNLLSSQAAISLENASLYQEMQTYSQKLESKNTELINTNESLQAEIAERKRVEKERLQLLQQLQVERSQLEAVLRQMPAGVMIAEAPTGKLIMGNEQVEQIWRHAFLPSENIDQYRQWKGFHPDGRFYSPTEWPLARSIITGEVVIGEEIGYLRGDRTYGTLCVSSAPVRNSSGQIVAGVITFYDITENKQAEYKLRTSLTEKEVLLKEIHHRVKNNLQIISSLLNLQSAYIKDERVVEIFKDSENRVATMSLIHEQLYQSKDLATIDFPEYIDTLVANLFSSYELNSSGIEVKLNLDNICLGIDAAVPCGLIINELVLNSLKHAFPAEQGGEILIELNLENKNVILQIGDNGIGFPASLDFRNTETLGLQLVMALTNQLEGTIAIYLNQGTKFTIIFPTHH